MNKLCSLERNSNSQTGVSKKNIFLWAIPVSNTLNSTLLHRECEDSGEKKNTLSHWGKKNDMLTLRRPMFALWTGAGECISGGHISPHHNCAFVMLSNIKQKSPRYSVTKKDLFRNRKELQFGTCWQTSYMHAMTQRWRKHFIGGKRMPREGTNTSIEPSGKLSSLRWALVLT